MKAPRPSACLNVPLLRYVRDARPTEEQFLTWLGPNSSQYHVLRKAGLLQLLEGRIQLSDRHLSKDGRRFQFENALFLLDENQILTF